MKENEEYNVEFFIESIKDHYAKLETSESFVLEKVIENGDYQCILPLYGMIKIDV